MDKFISEILQFGFAAVMAIIIFRAYQIQTERFMVFMTQTTTTLEKIKETMEDMTEAIKSLDRRVEDLEKGMREQR